MANIYSLKHAKALDDGDELKTLKSRFTIPDGIIYLDGNSLGALPSSTVARLKNVVEREWGDDLIKSWNSHNWINQPRVLGDKIAKIIGAEAGEVVACDSTSVNLFKVVAQARSLRLDRKKILSEQGNFPTDLYVLQGLVEMLGEGTNYVTTPTASLLDAIDADTAVVVLTHVNFKSGAIHDMAAITKYAHDMGALVVWDLCHSAGAIPLSISGDGADYAVGCGYKYLNGGPGSPAFLYVAKRHQNKTTSPLTGWMGHANPFEFSEQYDPAGDIERNLCGSPVIIALAALDEGLKTFDGVDMEKVRAKSIGLSTLFVDLMAEKLGDYGFELACPKNAAERGSQVSYTHEHGYAIMQALIDKGIIGDFRAPDIMRFGFAPLYIAYADVWRSVEVLREIMDGKRWQDPTYALKSQVT
jgi:kynureninase